MFYIYDRQMIISWLQILIDNRSSYVDYIYIYDWEMGKWLMINYRDRWQ